MTQNSPPHVPSSPFGAQHTPVTIVLTNNQTAMLDEIAAAIRRRTGSHVSRSAMVRAITAGVLPYHEDWMNCRSEGQVLEMVKKRLRVGTKP